jgi:hypothetical protein
VGQGSGGDTLEEFCVDCLSVRLRNKHGGEVHESVDCAVVERECDCFYQLGVP